MAIPILVWASRVPIAEASKPLGRLLLLSEDVCEPLDPVDGDTVLALSLLPRLVNNAT